MISRSHLSEALCLVAVGAYTLASCVSTQDPLRVALDANTALVAAITAVQDQQQQRAVSFYQRRAALCPPSGAERDTCLSDAGRAAVLACASVDALLSMTVTLQQSAAVSLDAARQCRLDEASCEAAMLQAAERTLSQARASLTRAALLAAEEAP